MIIEPVVKVSDVITKFGFSKNTAIKFMNNEELHSYRLGAPLYCSRENFDAYINKLNDIGWKTYGGGVRVNREKLKNTLEPVIKAKDIMAIYDVCKGTALKIMGHKSLCSYRPTNNMLVCERQYFSAFIARQEKTGGLMALSMSYDMGDYSDEAMEIFIFLKSVCTEEEFERLTRYGINFQNI